ncbi:MAG: vWA domain-containing protein [Alphaproteobacteria bacterium]
MSASERPVASEGGLLAANVVHFGRALRAAGMPVGTGQILDALKALEETGLGSRADLYWTLFAVFVTRAEQRELYDQTFHIFWRDPQLLERLMQLMLPTVEADNPPPSPEEEVSRRVADAMAPEKRPGAGEDEEQEEVEFDAAMTYSASEVLQTKDFEDMTAAEVAAAKRAMRRFALPIAEVTTRRFDPAAHGPRVDLRRTLRGSLSGGGAIIDLEKKKRRTRHPPLVVLCDISGSMSRYSRLLLHFLHALTNDRDRVHTFLFGTALTNVTRQLKSRDIDVALDKIGAACTDWSGGTRIGTCLERFNRVWSRRVLAQGAVVLLITDGLDRDAGKGLEKQMDRLQRSCRELIWLNPLLRYDAYAPVASGAKAMIRHVDALHSIHNLESLDQLAHIMRRARPTRGAMRRWVQASEQEAA